MLWLPGLGFFRCAFLWGHFFQYPSYLQERGHGALAHVDHHCQANSTSRLEDQPGLPLTLWRTSIKSTYTNHPIPSRRTNKPRIYMCSSQYNQGLPMVVETFWAMSDKVVLVLTLKSPSTVSLGVSKPSLLDQPESLFSSQYIPQIHNHTRQPTLNTQSALHISAREKVMLSSGYSTSNFGLKVYGEPSTWTKKVSPSQISAIHTRLIFFSNARSAYAHLLVSRSIYFNVKMHGLWVISWRMWVLISWAFEQPLSNFSTHQPMAVLNTFWLVPTSTTMVVVRESPQINSRGFSCRVYRARERR